MKNYYLYFCFLFVILCAVSCKTKENESNVSENKQVSGDPGAGSVKKLRIMGHWYGEGKKETLVREAVREFSLLNQDLNVTLEFPHQIYKFKDESELFFLENDSVTQMVKKNEWPWDVLFLDRERYKYVGQNLKDPNWGEKYLVNFEDQQWFTAAHKKDFLTSLNLSESYGGILPGPVLEGISYVLFVSTSVEKKLGIKVKDLDMNFSDFTEYARKVYEYNTTHSDKITFFSTQMGNAPLLMFSQVVLSIYGKAEGGDRKDALASLDKAYKIMESIAAYKPLDQSNSIAGLGYDKAQRILFDKNCLFDLQPTWIYLLWLKSNPAGTLQMRPCELPSADQCRSPFYPGFFQVIFVVPKNCNNPKEAEKFIKFISSGEIADKWIKYSRCPTGLKNNISYTEFGQDLFNIYFRHIQNKYGNNQVETDLSGFLFKSEKKINFSENNILSGSMTAEACMKEVLRQLK